MKNDLDDLSILLDEYGSDNPEPKVESDTGIYDKYEQEIASLSRDLGINLGGPPAEIFEPEIPTTKTPPAEPSEPLNSSYGMPQGGYYQNQNSWGAPSAHQGSYQGSYQGPQQGSYQGPYQGPYQGSHSGFQSWGPPPSQPQYTYAQPQKHYFEDDECNKECEEDEKLHLLEKIKHMTEILEKTENGDISDLPTISRNHSIREIRDVHKMLIQKTNRIRYTELGQQLILNGARLLSHVFDGNNEFFGKKIDLRGLPTRIDYKLQYIKPQLADVVQRFCSDWDPMLLTGVELLAIVATHSYENASTIKKDNLYEDFEKGTSEMYKM